MAVALIVSWTSPGDNCAVDGGDGDCRMVTGATIVISGLGDGSLGDNNGTATGGRSFLAMAEGCEEDSSAEPTVGLVILLKQIKIQLNYIVTIIQHSITEKEKN